MRHIPIVLACSTLLIDSVATGQESLLSTVVSQRRAIHAGEVTVRVHQLINSREPAMAGAEQNVHGWFDIVDDSLRLDEEFLNDSHFDKGRFEQRYSVGGPQRRYRFIDDTRSRKPLREYTAKPTPEKLVPDLRTLGLNTVRYSSLPDFGLHAVEALMRDATLAQEKLAGGGVQETYTNSTGARHVYTFDAKNSLISIEFSSAPGNPHQNTRVEIENREIEGVGAFPSQLRLTDKIAGKVVYSEIADIEVRQFNQFIDPRIYSWSALEPPAGTRLVIDHDYQSQARYWNGSQFADVPPELISNRSVDLIALNKALVRRNILLSICATVAVGLVMVFILRRLRRRAER